MSRGLVGKKGNEMKLEIFGSNFPSRLERCVTNGCRALVVLSINRKTL